jgi:hypothetical protein
MPAYRMFERELITANSGQTVDGLSAHMEQGTSTSVFCKKTSGLQHATGSNLDELLSPLTAISGRRLLWSEAKLARPPASLVGFVPSHSTQQDARYHQAHNLVAPPQIYRVVCNGWGVRVSIFRAQVARQPAASY